MKGVLRPVCLHDKRRRHGFGFRSNQLNTKKIIAMWSGPRNLSTAMMRSFGARLDCQAIDEPFYAAYLAATGLNHPMRQEIIADGQPDPGAVVGLCLTPAVAPETIVYQKHMTHHMIDGFDTSWIDQVTNVFLIRAPVRVLASYAVKTETVEAADIGFAKQRELFEYVANKKGLTAPIVDAADIRADPAGMLRALCQAIEIPFDPAMLAWAPGPRPEDGIWARHWYDAVWKSSGFAPAETTPMPDLPDALKAIADEVREDFEYLYQRRLRPV